MKKEKGHITAKVQNKNNLICDDMYLSLPAPFNKMEAMDRVERDIKFLGQLITSSACLPNFLYVYLGEYMSPHLHLFIEGVSGSGKGHAIGCKGLLSSIQEELNKKNDELRNEWAQSSKEEKTLKPECPYKMLKVPANSTTSSIYKAFADNEDNGLLLATTEADGLLESMSKEHGKLISALIRQACEHEKLEKSIRTNNWRADVHFPKLALLLTGTTDQREKLAKNNGGINGLTTRLMYYQINELREINSGVKALELCKLSEDFESDLFDKWKLLNDRQEPLKYRTSEELFVEAEKWNWGVRIPLEKQNIEFRSICLRLQKEFFRTMMVLRALEANEDELMGDFLDGTEKELYQAKYIFTIIYRHSLAVHEQFISNKVNQPKSSKQDVLKKCNNIFRHNEFTEKAKHMGVHEATGGRWLATLVSQGLVTKREGCYEKTKLQFSSWENKPQLTEKTD